MTTLFELPAYRVGPYDLKVYPAVREMFTDKRRKVETDWTRGVVHLHADLEGRRALHFFFRQLVGAIHYRSGVDDRSSEETMTHSLATGLVEVARNNREFWAQLMGIVERELKPGAGYESVFRGTRAAGKDIPKLLTYRGGSCTVGWGTYKETEGQKAYAWYIFGDKTIKLSPELSSANLAVVLLHEVLHFIHDHEKLTDRTKELPFRRTQARGLMHLIEHNPTFWRWWLAVVRDSALAPA